MSWEKLCILGDAAKYDASCASSGVDRKGVQGSVGSAGSFGHLSQLERRRPLYLAAKGAADQPVHVPLCLLRQFRRPGCTADGLSAPRNWPILRWPFISVIISKDCF